MKQVDFNTQLMTAIDLASRILAARVLSMVGLGMTFGLFCWAMYLQSVLGFIGAGSFAVGVFLPTLIGERRKEKDDGPELS